MLFRGLVVHALAGVLLVCPYCCLSQAGSASAGATTVRKDAGMAPPCHACKCCGGVSGSDRAKGQSDRSGSQRQGGDCLCHGAVLQSPTTPLSLDSGLAAFLPVDDLLAGPKSSIFSGGLFAVEHTACHFASADSGREVRALIESLLL